MELEAVADRTNRSLSGGSSCARSSGQEARATRTHAMCIASRTFEATLRTSRAARQTSRASGKK
eukprot:5617907-Pyramimonas_sp.AAC.1